MQIMPQVYFYPFNSVHENNANTIVIDGPEKIIIDPGHKHLWPDLKTKIEADGLDPEDFKMVVMTHYHPDHLEAADILERDYGMVQAMHSIEADYLSGPGKEFFPWLGLDYPSCSIGRRLEEGPLDLGDKTIDVYLTPGHSPGGICLHWPNAGLLITGDLFFARGVGRTDLPGGDYRAQAKSIARMAALKDVEIILPGHGPAIIGRDQVEANYKNIAYYL